MAKGDILYKYRSLNEDNIAHVEDIFVNNRIYFPSATEFNDPFDCTIELSLSGTEDQWHKYVLQGLKRRRPELSSAERLQEAGRVIKSGAYKRIDPSITTRILQTVGIYCLSAIRDDILMWSHYSEKHTGIVLEFRAGPQDVFFRRAFPVKYQDEYPSTTIFDSDRDRMTASVLTKAAHWAYEQEYRIIEYQRGPGLYEFPEHLLTGVIFGCQMSEKRKEQIQKWISRRVAKPVIYQAKKKDHEFGLSIDAVP